MSNKFTNMIAVVGLLLVPSISAHAQYQQVPVQGLQAESYYPFNSYYPNYSSTIEEGYLRGSAAYAQAYGQMQLSAAQAAVQQEQARRAAIENDVLWTQRRLEYKELISQNRKREADQRNAESVRYLANRPALVGLDSTQIDADGSLAWPQPLQSKNFAHDRAILDEYFHSVANGIFDSHSTGTLVAAQKRIADEFNAQIDKLPSAEFIPAMRFLNRLNVQIQRPQRLVHPQSANAKMVATRTGVGATNAN